jgi:glucans biosynthesis protein C
MRRYDIDWLRVIAIGLLLIYHIAIGFQPWGMMIGFITSPTSWTGLWLPMTLLNVWRIPLLFFVSGMGVYFAMQQRTWKELITERMLRIALPFVFGMFAIVPLHVYVLRDYYNLPAVYAWGPGHLWFLRNIFGYVLILSPVLFFLKRKENNPITLFVKNVFSKPWGLLIVVAAFVAEVMIIKPVPFELYAMTWHGFVLGLLAFFFGFCFVLSGEAFWKMIQDGRWIFLALASALFAFRVWYYTVPGYCLAIESVGWIITVLAFGSKYLNKPGRALTYLSGAAYPVYILHMVFLYLGSWLLFKLSMPAPLQFVLVLVFTVAGCFGAYEIIRRIKWIRPLFGMKMK